MQVPLGVTREYRPSGLEVTLPDAPAVAADALQQRNVPDGRFQAHAVVPARLSPPPTSPLGLAGYSGSGPDLWFSSCHGGSRHIHAGCSHPQQRERRTILADACAPRTVSGAPRRAQPRLRALRGSGRRPAVGRGRPPERTAARAGGCCRCPRETTETTEGSCTSDLRRRASGMGASVGRGIAARRSSGPDQTAVRLRTSGQ